MAYTSIDNPELYFQAKTWTGTGNEIAITFDGSENMQPDWVWSKARDSLGSITGNHFLYDSVRGAGAEKELSSNSTGVEGANANHQYGYISSFNTDGFTTTAGSSNNDYFNKSSVKYVAWNWKAGGTASSNTDGDETTSVSVNQTAGFSIVSYTGTGSVDTFGHGLGAKPNLMIQKKRSGSAAWTVYHDKVDANPSHKYLYLSSTAALADYADHFNDTEPTSSVFTLGTDTSINGSGATNIMYCFAEKKGYSKFTSFTGNGSTDGPFVYLGFRASFVIIKRTDTSANWQMYDNKRDGYNGAGYPAKGNESLRPNTSEAESSATGYDIDICANGIKLRNSNSTMNSSGATHIVMAFAESPFVNSSGIPCNAR